MEVGDRVTVYRKVGTVKEMCDRGVTHNVPVYSIKFLTITHVAKEMIVALNYTSDGIGNVYYALDAQGRSYSKKDHWDGPRASGWIRTDAYVEKKFFDQYPPKVYSRDLTGRGFIP